MVTSCPRAASDCATRDIARSEPPSVRLALTNRSFKLIGVAASSDEDTCLPSLSR